MGCCNTCPVSGPNEALVISGGCCGGQNTTKVIMGGWGCAWCCLSNIQRLTMEVMTVIPMCSQVETSQGVALTVTGVAQIKVMSEPEFLSKACEQFLGKEPDQIKGVILQTMEGHLRAILGTMTVEDIYQDREQFARNVREVAQPDVGRMGIEIVSFTIKDIYDEVDYLDSLGRAQTAAVKRDADIGVAEAERDAGIRESECQREMQYEKFDANTKIANYARSFEMKQSEFQVEVKTKQAEAELAYQLEASKVKQNIRKEEVEIEIVERRKQIEVQDYEIMRKEKELEAIVKKPVEADSYKVEMIAQASKTVAITRASGEAEKIRMIGGAEAIAIEAKGKAEAEQMRMKAAAYKQYGDAAKMSLVLDALPKLAGEVAKPLAKTDEIVIIGGESTRTTSEVSRMMSQLPPVVQALTGVKLTEKLPQLFAASASVPSTSL